MPKPIVQLVDVCKSYRRGSVRTTVLDRVSLAVSPGECLLLVGPSGCGKSTMLSLVGCLLEPDSGQIYIDGQDISQLQADGKAEFRSRTIGFVFQQHHLIRGLNAWENVAIPLLLRGISSDQAQEHARAMLRIVGLEHQVNSHPAHMSMGQCQRVALARALIGNPPLILADEPTASLDAESGRSAMELIRGLTKQLGKTAIVVTHDPRIFPYADRIIQLDNGTVLTAGTATHQLVPCES